MMYASELKSLRVSGSTNVSDAHRAKIGPKTYRSMLLRASPLLGSAGMARLCAVLS